MGAEQTTSPQRGCSPFDLETQIDREGLHGLLETIAEICHEKAIHLESSWQDVPAAMAWTRMAKRIETLVVAAKDSLP